MNKEVNQSLIRWPAAAAGIILVVSWFLMGEEVERATPLRKPQINVAPGIAVLLETDVEIPQPKVDQSERGERGMRAMKLPSRIAKAFEVAPSQQAPAQQVENPFVSVPVGVVKAPVVVVKAPVRSVQQELAGLEFRESQDRSEVLPSNSATAESKLGFVIIDNRCCKTRPAWLVELMPPTFWETDLDLSASEGKNPASILAQASKELGRRDLSIEATQEVDWPWSGLTQWVRSGLHQVENTGLEWLAMLTRESEHLQVAFRSNQEVGKPDQDEAGVPPTSSVVPVVGLISAEGDEAIPQVTQSVGRKVTETRVASANHLSGWPEAKQLVVQLKQLSKVTDVSGTKEEGEPDFLPVDELSVADWSNRVQGLLIDLRALPRLGDQRAGEIIASLDSLAKEGQRQAEMLDDRELQVLWLRTTFALLRRTAVWRPVWDLSQSQDAQWTGQVRVAGESLEVAINRLRADLVATGDSSGWDNYLLLDEVTAAAKSEDLEKRARVSQRVLSRLEWHRLDEGQADWLNRESIQQLVSVIRPWARKAIDYANLMSQIERQESNAIDLAAVDIASAAQSLRFAESPTAVKVSDVINTHYRNANVRFAISEQLMERMMPRIESKSVPVKTRLMGAQVHGTSRIESGFDFDLQPSADRWSMNLRTLGRVNTNSVGKQGGVSVRTVGDAKFDAASRIEVTANGVYVGDAQAVVAGRTRLREIETDYDGWPLVGMLVRSIAEDRYQTMAPQANRVGNQHTRRRIESEIDQQLNQRIDQAAAKMSEMVLGPLGRLQLDPQVTDMQTTDQRILARYRVAGDWQLGAFTPRPRALSDSVMSVQVHQSALNNTLEQLIPGEQPIGIRNLIQNSAATFGKGDLTMPDDIPDDVSVQFARTRPVTVEIEDGILWLTLRVLKLTRDEGLELTQFIVRAAYRPEIDGIHARLVRDGHLRISGPRMAMRERLPVRAIFNKVLSANREIPLTVPRFTESPASEGLIVSQLELRDGWIAIALSAEGAARIALQNQDDPKANSQR